MVLANNAEVTLRYRDLWAAYRGGPLRIQRLHADQLDAQIERLADGRASWQFDDPKARDLTRGARPLSLGELQIADGKALFKDAVLEANLDARFSLTERSLGEKPSAPASLPRDSPPSERSSIGSDVRGLGLNLRATGQYRELPLKVELRTSGVLEAAGPDGATARHPVALKATIGRARVRFDGVAADAVRLTDLQGRFEVAGPSLAAVGDPLGVTLPTTAPFETRGSLTKRGGVWKADFDEAAIGESRLQGAFTFDREPRIPVLSGKHAASRLVLADLGPAIGVAPRAGGQSRPAELADDGDRERRGKVMPDRRFDLPSLREMNADVSLDIAHLDLGTSHLEPIRPLRGHLGLQGGVLTLSDLDGRTADGRLTGTLQLDGRSGQAVWTADLRLRDIRLERWMQQAKSKGGTPYVTGQLDGQVQVSGVGRSTAEILGSLEGGVGLHLRKATVSHMAVEVAGLDVAEALGLWVKGDEALVINCNVADLRVSKGVVRPRVFVVDTKDSTLSVDGYLSLQSETLDLRGAVLPKDFSPLTLRTPILIKGTFSTPVVSIEKGKVVARVAVAAALAFVNPVAAVIPFFDPGSSDDAKREAAECASLRERGNSAKAAHTKVKSK